MPKENEIQLTKLLIVEGNHERDFFHAWFNHSGINDIQVMPIGGKTILSDNLKALKKQANFTNVVSLVIIRDADDQPTGAFQSVSSALSAAGLLAPTVVEQFITQETPKIAIMIMPCHGESGALEELLLRTASTDPLAPAATSFIDQAVAYLTENPLRPSIPAHRQGKAKIHAFLATFDQPDRDPGKAALAGVWNFDDPALDPLRTIIQQM